MLKTNNIFYRLQQRKYPNWMLDRALNRVTQIPRNQLLAESKTSQLTVKKVTHLLLQCFGCLQAKYSDGAQSHTIYVEITGVFITLNK